MTKFALWFGVLAATALTGVSGLIDAALRHREAADALIRAGQRIERLPGDFGRWRLLKEEPLHASTAHELQCRGYVNRSYVHLDNGDRVNVAVVVGPAGPTAVHTPEICYSAREYELADPPEKRRLRAPGAGEHEFRRVGFRSRQLPSATLSVYYAWSDGRGWQAPEAPRLMLTHLPKLYKIQVAAYADQGATPDPCEAFLRDFLPILDSRMQEP
ncbi:MAG: EpsI family protein [Planctomycetes bacterium]|nr:EpsI family protein [Planctomycetota bacterium]